MKSLFVVFIIAFAQIASSTVTISGYGSSSYEAQNVVGSSNYEDKVEMYSNAFELFIIKHETSTLLYEAKLRFMAITEYRDVGTAGNGYSSTDTQVIEYTGATFGTVSNLGSNQFGFSSSNNVIVGRGVADTSATTLRSVVSANISSISYSGIRQASDTSIALKFEVVAIKKAGAGLPNVVWNELTTYDQILDDWFGGVLGYARLAGGSEVSVQITRNQVNQATPDKKWFIWISFIGAGTSVNFEDVMLWRSTEPVTSSTGALTSGAVTSAALSTGAVTSAAVTSGEVTSGADVTTGEVTTGTCMCPCEC